MSDSLIQRFFDAQNEVFKYFGYVEDWTVIPLGDQRGDYWMICGPEDNSGTTVAWSPDPFTEKSIIEGKTLYTGTIYTQCFLPKWVYRGEDHTMVSVDTHSDGNKLLMIFDNKLECTDEKMKKLLDECW